MLGILSKINTGHRVFGLSFGDMCEDWLQHQQDRVDTDRITKGCLDTLKTQVRRWIVPYIGKREKVGSLDRNSFYDYGMFRRKQTGNQVEDVTIRNEYTTINAIARWAYRHGIIPFEKFNVEGIRIREMPRRDTFTPEEYKLFYTRMREWVKGAEDGHEIYYRSVIQNFILLKSNTFCRFGELRLLNWHMVKLFKHDGDTLVELSLPSYICENRKDRQLVQSCHPVRLGRIGLLVKSIKAFWRKSSSKNLSRKQWVGNQQYGLPTLLLKSHLILQSLGSKCIVGTHGSITAMELKRLVFSVCK